MKLSISLSEEDVALVDAYVERAGLPSRSAAIQKAIRTLRYPALEENYAHAWEEWADGDTDAWESTAGDGVSHAAR
ncbi:antitoxin [Mycobacterium sp. ITM-2017-0098]|nr:antitoxin [Mycobacterium sp. ITM-2017-0098]